MVTGVSWSTTYAPLQQLGLKLKLIDINLKNFNVDEDLLEKAITKNTKLIVVVNLLGIPCDLNRIKKLCDKKKFIYLRIIVKVWGKNWKKKLEVTVSYPLIHSFFTICAQWKEE